MIRNPLCIFYLNKQHPSWLEKLTACRSSYGSLLPISFNPLSPRVHPCCVCTSLLVSSTFHRDGWSTCGCLAVFPRFKGRTNSSLFFLFDCLVALIMNRDTVRSRIIPELCVWLELFPLAGTVFVYSIRLNNLLRWGLFCTTLLV